MRDRLAVQHDLSDREGPQGRCDGPELARPGPALPRPQPNLFAVLADHDAKPVVLDFMDPARAGRDGIGEDRLARLDKARRRPPVPGQRRTHQHGSPNLGRDAPSTRAWFTVFAPY